MKQFSEFKSFTEMLAVLKTEEDCRKFLELHLWGAVPVCGKCGLQDKNHYKLKVKGKFKGKYRCLSCKENFNVKCNTIYEGSHVPLRKWMIALWLVGSRKKGFTSILLAEELGVTQKTAWYMLQRIRSTMIEKNPPKMTGICMSDESFVGGIAKFKHKDKREKRVDDRKFRDKIPVMGILEKEINIKYERPHKVIPNKTVVVKTIIKPSKIVCFPIAAVTKKDLIPNVRKYVAPGATVVTDEWRGYTGLHNWYHHQVVDHMHGRYKNEFGYSTNALEGAWKNLKGTIKHTHHWVSKKHIHLYTLDFAFRYNNRNNHSSERFVKLVENPGERLMYKDLIADLNNP